MSESYQTSVDELLAQLEFISDENRLYDSWFVTGLSSPEDEFDSFFDVPHIEWEKIAPEALKSKEYNDFYSILDFLSGDTYRRSDHNNHVDVDLVLNDPSWRKIPPLAKKLKEMVEEETSKTSKNQE